jgi:hypothetical protein
MAPPRGRPNAGAVSEAAPCLAAARTTAALRASLVSKSEGHQHEVKREQNDPGLVSDMGDLRFA